MDTKTAMRFVEKCTVCCFGALRLFPHSWQEECYKHEEFTSTVW